MKPEIERLLESNDDELPYYAWPGGYPIIYIDGQNEILCPECANVALKEEEWEEWKPQSWDIYYEGFPLECRECGTQIESAYGEVE